MFNSFFLLNCYICFNESATNFLVRPPSLSEYIPLEDDIPTAPVIEDFVLGDVYDYRTPRDVYDYRTLQSE